MATTGIQWTGKAVPLRFRASAASRTGLTLTEYDTQLAAGKKWCTGCKAWHPRSGFGKDKSRADGLAARCRAFKNNQARNGYSAKERPVPGRRYVAARDGDEKQARRRVNYLVDLGLLDRPNALPCTDCGHIWRPGEKRHEYDHHLGYGSEHHEHVEAVCTTCHHHREETRRTAS